jgi:hypothetical protein
MVCNSLMSISMTDGQAGRPLAYSRMPTALTDVEGVLGLEQLLTGAK